MDMLRATRLVPYIDGLLALVDEHNLSSTLSPTDIKCVRDAVRATNRLLDESRPGVPEEIVLEELKARCDPIIKKLSAPVDVTAFRTPLPLRTCSGCPRCTDRRRRLAEEVCIAELLRGGYNPDVMAVARRVAAETSRFHISI
jgi:hypothetical protein